MDPKLAAVIEKVKRLLALAKSSNPHEAANAAAKADELMQQHRLSEAEVEAVVQGKGDRNETIEEDADPLCSFFEAQAWRLTLSRGLCQAYGVAFWLDLTKDVLGKPIRKLIMVGRRSDVEMVRTLYAWLSTEITRLMLADAKGKTLHWRSSYCEGAAEGVVVSLGAQRASQRPATGHGSKALVLLDDRYEESRRRMYELHPNLGKVHAKNSRPDWSAKASGRQAGGNIHLGASMSAKGSRLLK
jgi:hypothetical protein